MDSTLLNGNSTFKLIRPSIVAADLTNPLDSYALYQLNKLDGKLGIKFLEDPIREDGFQDDGQGLNPQESSFGSFYYINETLSEALKLDLAELVRKTGPAGPDLFNFSEVIDKAGDTATYYDVQQLVVGSNLTYNVAKMLSYPNIQAYLFCKAHYYLRLNSSAAIFKYITNDVDGGAKLIYDFVVIKAANKIVQDKKLEVGHHFQDIIGPKLKAAKISFADGVFSEQLFDIISDQVFDKNEYEIINSVKEELNISDDDIPALVNYIKSSNIKITKSNALYYLPVVLNDLKNSNIIPSSLGTDSTDATEADFAVNYYEDEKGTLEINRKNVFCAAQMFYVMTLGDELEIFNVINRITSKYLPSGQLDIRSRDTLQDLQLYVFSESFRDLKSGSIYKRTHPEERKMFYKQIFNAGNTDVVEGMAVNSDFDSIWGRLMMECVKYIQDVKDSQNAMYVSRQNIYQAIEDLQYNLSTYCVGMAKVAAPIINKELDFVVERFLKSPELIKQLAYNNSGSFWKVVERVIFDMRKEVPNVTAIRNKAVFGHQIITTVANYTPTLLDSDAAFSTFISTVEAFVLSSDESGTKNSMQAKNQMPAIPQIPKIPGIPGMPNMPSIPGQDNNEWNF